MTTTEKLLITERIMCGASLDERDKFWKLVAEGRGGEQNVLHLVLAGVRALNDPSNLRLVTDKSLAGERAMR